PAVHRVRDRLWVSIRLIQSVWVWTVQLLALDKNEARKPVLLLKEVVESGASIVRAAGRWRGGRSPISRLISWRHITRYRNARLKQLTFIPLIFYRNANLN